MSITSGALMFFWIYELPILSVVSLFALVFVRQFNDFFQDRRLRLFSVTAGIPPVMWYTVAVGAVINMILIWLFDLRLRTHFLLGGLISFFTGTMICLIVLLDNPFRGEVGVSPQAFELIYSQMMSE